MKHIYNRDYTKFKQIKKFLCKTFDSFRIKMLYGVIIQRKIIKRKVIYYNFEKHVFPRMLEMGLGLLDHVIHITFEIKSIKI